ncbi:MAG: hypothetical protein ACLT98_04120 [Eggerthellaceae bacterium]
MPEEDSSFEEFMMENANIARPSAQKAREKPAKRDRGQENRGVNSALASSLTFETLL